MGSILSTRWKGYKRKWTVEECRRVEAPKCLHCGHRVQFLYVPPDLSQVPENCACRRCHDLTYASIRLRRTLAGELARDAFLLADTRREALALLSDTGNEAPPDEIIKQGRKAIARWFRERDANDARAMRLLHFVSRVPAASELRALKRAWNGD